MEALFSGGPLNGRRQPVDERTTAVVAPRPNLDGTFTTVTYRPTTIPNGEAIIWEADQWHPAGTDWDTWLPSRIADIFDVPLSLIREPYWAELERTAIQSRRIRTRFRVVVDKLRHRAARAIDPYGDDE